MINLLKSKLGVTTLLLSMFFLVSCNKDTQDDVQVTETSNFIPSQTISYTITQNGVVIAEYSGSMEDAADNCIGFSTTQSASGATYISSLRLEDYITLGWTHESQTAHQSSHFGSNSSIGTGNYECNSGTDGIFFLCEVSDFTVTVDVFPNTVGETVQGSLVGHVYTQYLDENDEVQTTIDGDVEVTFTLPRGI